MNLTVNHIGKSYRKNKKWVPALHDFSYRFESGKIYVVKGESGRGKTTLLTILALLQDPTEGELFFDERNVLALGSEEKCAIRRDQIGIVFQDCNLFSGLSVLENVLLIDRIQPGRNFPEAERKAAELLKWVGLEHRAAHFPHELSGGEQQRVGVARAIMKDPDVLICDEPVSNLDDENAEKIARMICEFGKEKQKLVIVSAHGSQFDQAADETVRL
ncbi:ATP-binding cassette domain-containing protein [Gorillibacterium sp. sgz500922]|uniref:ATP-binding cassette domain-containing protein n=1 Tax=Gorillibacterium sp. sgz500922 TaxID=3446694 RepID=UPI003F6681C3